MTFAEIFTFVNIYMDELADNAHKEYREGQMRNDGPCYQSPSHGGHLVISPLPK